MRTSLGAPLNPAAGDACVAVTPRTHPLDMAGTRLDIRVASQTDRPSPPRDRCALHHF